MYKVLLVDDEKVGRQGIRMLLNRMDNDFDIVECARAADAIDEASRNKFDFLITDIKMPKMNGIELIEHLKKENPDLICLIISGYADFSYAKNAMKMGVNHYIVKPVDPQEFYSAIQSMIASSMEQSYQRTVQQKQSHIAKEYILLSCIYGRKEEISSEDLAGLKPYRRMLLLEFPDNFFDSNASFLQFLKRRMPLKFDYLNIDGSQGLLLFECDDEDILKTAAKNLIDSIERQYQTTCYAALSSSIENLKQIHDIFSSLEDQILGRYLYPDQTLHLEGEAPTQQQMQTMENDLKTLQQDLSRNDLTAFRQDLNAFYAQPIVSNKNLSSYSKYLFSKIIKSMEDKLKSEGKNVTQQISAFYRARNTSDMENILDSLCTLLEQTDIDQAKKGHKEIVTVKRYIYSHYNEDLSVDQLADYVCLAPSYLSHIFKKETGENLGKFIKRVRMEKAKQMLDETYEKIITISVAVGYQNVSYFCHSFREYFGISPQKYRNQKEML